MEKEKLRQMNGNSSGGRRPYQHPDLKKYEMYDVPSLLAGSEKLSSNENGVVLSGDAPVNENQAEDNGNNVWGN